MDSKFHFVAIEGVVAVMATIIQATLAIVFQ
jgi:hypothetical protein